MSDHNPLWEQMNNELIARRIKDYAKLARERFEGSLLFGQPLDLNNIEHVLAALYAAHDAYLYTVPSKKEIER